MSYRVIIICIATLFIQTISGETSGCISSSKNGGPLSVSSSGPIAPSGLSLASDLSLAGDLGLSGALPFLSAVAFEGQYPTSGSATVSYGCGDCVAITQEVGNPSNVNSAVNSGSFVNNNCGFRRS